MKTGHVYFASCTKRGGIYHYRFGSDGNLHFVEKTLCDRPMYLIKNENRLHAVLREPFSDNAFSGIVTYEIGMEGLLGKKPELINTQGMCGCHLCSFQNELYVTNYLSGSVFCTHGGVRVHRGSGIDPVRQEAPHTHYVSPSPDGRYLMVTDLGLDRVYVYDRNLNEVSVTKLPDGSGPRHMACLDDRYVVCVNELACTVTMLEYRNGCMMPLQSIPVFFEKKRTPCTSAAIRAYKDYVYVSNRGDNTISAIKVLDGKLELKSVTPCGGESPRDFDIAEGYLLCANEESSTVTVLKVEGEKLTLLPGKTIEGMESVLCICGNWRYS